MVDVETTGWSPDADGITEIGAVRLSGGEVCASSPPWSTRAVSSRPTSSTLTGITDAMVNVAPPVGAVLPGFLDFARGSVLTAHNAPFDVGFLTAACAGTGRRWPAPPVLDTVTLARLLLTEDEVPNCKLATLADFFGAPARPRHRALADARATAAVLAALLDRLTATGVLTLAQLSAAERAAARQPPPVCPPPRRRGRSPAAEQRYATPEGPPADGHKEAAGDHRDRAVEGRCGEDPRDGGEVAQIPQVTEVYSVTGEFDLVALVRVRAYTRRLRRYSGW